MIGLPLKFKTPAIFSFFAPFILNKNKGIPPIYVNALTSSANGYGYDSGDQAKKRHYPMTCALILSAESNRYNLTNDNAALKNAIQNADWLAESNDIDKDGIIGWGLPFAWDAFSDGVKNPVHTVYTITTALAVQSLLDIIDAIDQADSINKDRYVNKKSFYLKVAQEAIDSFIDNKFYTENTDGTIFFWYSSQKSDALFVTNVNAMFAGILQRISDYSIAKNRKELYRGLADKGVKYVLENKVEENKAWYWIYYPGAKNPRENDLVHACYTADGLLMYKKYNGYFSDDIDEQRILNGLKLFIGNGKILELFSRPELFVRSWGLGYFFYVISNYYFQERDIKEVIFSHILKREERSGFRFKDVQNSPTNFVRHNAHILLGLSKYFWNGVFRKQESG
jgi:hypothetical protein